MVGLIPLFAAEVLDEVDITENPIFRDRLNWFAENRPTWRARLALVRNQNAR